MKISRLLIVFVMILSLLLCGCNMGSKEIEVTSSEEFASHLGAGWNLGNTFDASNCDWLEDEMEYEKAWCGVYTTRELIKMVADAGYKTLRLPVSWHNHVDENDVISEGWMARVKEVVNWCLEEDMFVILNSHHDVEEGFYYPDSEHYERSAEYMKNIWEQIAEEFKDYGNMLIFESVNEPRAVDTNHEWWFNMSTLDTNYVVQDCIETVCKLNQVFVDVVRASGGNNSQRYLMIPGYDTSVDGIANDYFYMPTDTADDKLMVTVHIYSDNPDDYLKRMDEMYNRYVANGIPVIIGEFSEYNTDRDRVEVDAEYVQYAAERKMICVRWDNNGDGGVIIREPLSWRNEAMAKNDVKYAYKPQQ